ncbi:MAG TPA: hypothetical protein VHT73_00180 [Thermodesulfobacteriota bacterium]|nr:hypothetical protein [Thermodesulfobacteriota bacterium]
MEIEEIINLLKKMDHNITKATQKQSFELPHADAMILLMLYSAIGIFRAVIELLNTKLVVESYILVRSLLEVSLRLMYLTQVAS